jgi:heme-degrading monooxygenase HmoA
MLAKMMTCHVHDNQKDVFSYKQQHWSALAHVDGFIGQLGGWNIDQPTEAFVLGLWDNEETYQDFMKNTHDSIFYKSGQETTYHHLDVDIFKQPQSIGGRYNFFRSSAIETRYMMVTTCKLHENEPLVIEDIIEQLIHPSFRCLYHVATPVHNDTMTIVSLYSTACPPKTGGQLVYPGVSNVKQNIYEVERKWLVLKQPS